MRRYITVAAAVFVIWTAFACSKIGGNKQPDKPIPVPPPPSYPVNKVTEVGGTYAGTGTNEDGSSYNCEVVITKEGDRYKVVWYFDGRPGYEGVGILKNNTLVVGFASEQGYGVVAYDVNADGSLAGSWAGNGNRKTCTERLTVKR